MLLDLYELKLANKKTFDHLERLMDLCDIDHKSIDFEDNLGLNDLSNRIDSTISELLDTDNIFDAVSSLLVLSGSDKNANDYSINEMVNEVSKNKNIILQRLNNE